MEMLTRFDDEMAELVPNEELEAEIQSVDEYEERVYGVQTKLNKALMQVPTVTPCSTATAGAPLTDPPPADRTAGRPSPSPPIDGTSPHGPDGTHPTDHNDTSTRVRLPKITLHRFNGN